MLSIAERCRSWLQRVDETLLRVDSACHESEQMISRYGKFAAIPLPDRCKKIYIEMFTVTQTFSKCACVACVCARLRAVCACTCVALLSPFLKPQCPQCHSALCLSPFRHVLSPIAYLLLWELIPLRRFTDRTLFLAGSARGQERGRDALPRYEAGVCFVCRACLCVRVRACLCLRAVACVRR